MKCRRCPEGRRFAAGSVNCILYGMIIREDHEGTREGCLQHDGAEAGSNADNQEAGIPEERWDDIDRLQGLLQDA